MEKLRYGILSTASIVPRFIKALEVSDSGEAVAIASRDLEKAKQKAAQLGIAKYYGSYEQLVADSQVQVVYVAMINSEHYKYAKLALEQGKHVVCEKPFTLHAEQAKQLFNLAKANNCFIMEAQKVVFLPLMQAIKEIIATNKLGKIHLMDLTSSCEPTYNTWLSSLKSGGGALYGNASYTIHLIKYLFNEEIENYSALRTKGDSQVDQQCALSFQLGNHILVTSKISTQVLAVNKAMIYGELGYIEIFDYWKARSATIYYKDKTEVIEFPCQYELQYECVHIAQCIQQNKIQSPIMNAAMSVSTIQLLEDIQKAWSDE